MAAYLLAVVWDRLKIRARCSGSAHWLRASRSPWAGELLLGHPRWYGRGIADDRCCERDSQPDAFGIA
jgi:hypothetical protein